ncbi:MAG TPA: histidine kinase, partial [Verrucomicrobiales bacterium]|nr:histidine kinase [Verrucomicrobiales bacterium]
KKLHSLTGKKGTALAMLSPDCPVSRRWFPELQRLEKEYSVKGIAFLFLAAPGEKDTAALQAIGMTGAILTDPDGQLLRALKATRTTDVFLLDAAKTLIYRGAVDDQYGTGYSRPAPEQRYLAAGLECLLAGTRPATAATEAPGCELELPAAPEKPAPSAPVTWHNRISRMVQAHCAACHHDGGAGPFSLETYAHMIKKAKTVRRVVADAVMPPWSAAPSPDPAHTAWQNESTLPAADKAALLAWLDGDRAEGDPAEAPLPPVLKKEAALGSPDLVLQLPAPIQIQAEGTMPYQSVFVNTGLKEDKWVSAWDVLPTASQVVHHVLIYVYPPGDELPGTAERRGHLASWVPGQGPALYPAGYAKALPAGSRLRFEIHYTPNGKPAEDRMRLALKFAPAPPDYAVESAGVADVLLDIPPGAASHPEAAEWTAPADIRVLSLSPHMHVRGKAMRFEVTAPHSEPRTLLEVPRYDFNWQIPVKYAEPPLLPKGSVIKVTGWFDNSSANPANPDPKATVHWGSQTNDEMMIGYVEYCRSLLPAQGRKETRGPSLTGETER